MMLRLSLRRLRNRWLKARLRRKQLDTLAAANLTALEHLDLNRKARDQRYVVFDLETTGLDLNRDRVLSVAAFRIVAGRIPLAEVFSSMVNPDRTIPSSSIKIHGIVPDMVAQAPPLEEVLDQFLSYLGTDILIGFHVRFDLHFIDSCMKKRYGFALQNLALDLSPMCRKLILPIHLRSYMMRHRRHPSLDEVAKRLHIEIPERHTALGDALATAMIFQRILAELEKRGPGRLRDLVSFGSII